MSNGLSGCTQYIWAAEDERRERHQNAAREAFIKYVIGFGKHASEIKRTCPVCKESSLRSVTTGVNEIGSRFLERKLLLTQSVLDDGKVTAVWKCDCCSYTEQKHVLFKDLLEDFNNPALRKTQ